MSVKSRNWLVFLQIVCSGAILAYLFRDIPFESLFSALAGASLPLVCLGMLGMLLAYWLDGMQMMWVLARQQIVTGVGRIVKINFICMFYGLFLPTMIAGGAIRWYHFANIERKPAEALAAILFNRVFETLLLVTVGLLAFVIEVRGRVELNLGLLFLAALVLILGTYALAFNRYVHEFARRIVVWLPLPSAVLQPIRRLLDALSRFDGMEARFHLRLFSLGLLRQAVAVGLVMVFVYALQVDVSLMTIVWVRSLVGVLTMIPISIAGLGIREATFVVVLGQFGVPGDQALALSLLLFSRILVYGIVGGVIEGGRVFLSRKVTVEAPR